MDKVNGKVGSRDVCDHAEAASKTRRGKQSQNRRIVRTFPKVDLTVPSGTR